MKLRFVTTCAGVAAAMAVLATGPNAIDPALRNKVRVARGQTVNVIVYLKDQRGSDVSERLRPRFEESMNQVAGQLQAIHRLQLPAGTMSRAQEDAFARTLQSRQPTSTELVLAHELDALKNQFVREVSDELEALYRSEHVSIAGAIQGLGGAFTGRIWVVNAVTARVPLAKIPQLANDSRVAMIFESGPNAAELTTSVPTFGAPNFWGGGFTGGAFDCGILDVSAVQQNQPGFAGKRFESNIGVSDSNGHPTNCAGIFCSGDATLRGVAYGLDTIASSMVNGTAVMMTNMNWMVTGTTERPEVINYSITDGTATGTDYAQVDQFFDGVCDTFNIIVAKSTGNGGFGSGNTTITRPAPAYNLLACASLNDQGNTNRADDRISSFSSRGPTAGGRKKPDIAAPGENITTLAPSGTTTGSGTSFAAPHIGGGVVLLLHRGVSDPMVAKAILLNNTDAMNDNDTSSTADDTFVNGSFWNRRYGWGYANLQRTYLHASDWFSTTLPAPPSGGRSFKLYKGPMLANDKATLTWNRHVGYNGGAFPTIIRALSNLDLIGYNQANNASVGQSISTIDNVEQFHVTAAASVVLKVVTTGLFDPNVANERFALATEEGFSAAVGPVFTMTASGAGEYNVNSVGQVIVNITNTGDVPAFNVTLNLTTQTPTNGNNVNIGTLNPGQSKMHTFTFTTPANAGELFSSATATSNSYGESFAGVGVGSVEVGGS